MAATTPTPLSTDLEHGLRRLKLRGLSGAREEFLLAAAAQNLRRLAKLTARGIAQPLQPA